MEPALEKTIMGSNTSREHVSLWGCSEGVPGGEEGEARPGRLLAGMVTHEGTVTHSRAHSASAFASTGRRASRSTPPPAAQDIKTVCPCGRLHRSSRGRSRRAIAAFKAGGAVGIGLLVSCRAETSHHGQQPLSTDDVWVDITAEYAPRH